MNANALEMMIFPVVRGLFAGVLLIVAGRGLVRMVGAVASSVLRPPAEPTVVTFAVPEE